MSRLKELSIVDRVLARLRARAAARARPTAIRSRTEPRANRPNIVMIGLDTLRADHLGCYGYQRPTSPHLDRLAKQSLIFRECYSTSAWTAPAWASVFTGALPSQHSLLFYPRPGVMRPQLATLAELLHDAGYLTAGFHGGGFVESCFGFGRGFLEYRSYGLRLVNSLAQCTRWLQTNRRRPFFLFWHGFDCHMPYDPPAEFDRFDPAYQGTFDVRKLYLADGALPSDMADHQHVVAKYDGEIAFADAMLGRFLRELESLQLLDRSLLLVVSDHGEEFVEHGCYDHTRTLYDELIRVPLLVRFPGSPRTGDCTGLVSLADLLPTVCEEIGLAAPACHGRSLGQLRNTPRRSVVAETGYVREYLDESEGLPWQHKTGRPPLLRGLRTGTWKFLLDEQDQPRELYNLSADPQERSNLLHGLPDVTHALKDAFHLEGSGVSARDLSTAAPGDEAMDPTVVDRLRSLGYL